MRDGIHTTLITLRDCGEMMPGTTAAVVALLSENKLQENYGLRLKKTNIILLRKMKIAEWKKGVEHQFSNNTGTVRKISLYPKSQGKKMKMD
jgi:hypothetical protein